MGIEQLEANCGRKRTTRGRLFRACKKDLARLGLGFNGLGFRVQGALLQGL